VRVAIRAVRSVAGRGNNDGAAAISGFDAADDRVVRLIAPPSSPRGATRTSDSPTTTMRFPPILRYFALILAFAGPAPAQDTSAETLTKVDALFAPWDSEEDPGMAVGIIHDGELVYAKGFGLANVELGVFNDSDVLYRIGSTSKQFTATAIALLALDGKLDVEAPLTDYFPEFSANDPPVLVRHLVHHSSGIPDYIGIQFASGGGPKAWFTPEQSLEVLSTAELEFVPGSQFSYSNSNYLLLGELVRRVSGQSLRDFAHKRIFDPLDMHASRYQDRHDEVIIGRSHGYSPQREEGRGAWKVDITHLDHVGDGGVFTTIEDLAKWDANFYDNQLGYDEQLLELLHTRRALNDGELHSYAMGLGIGTHRGLSTVSHSGGWVGYLAEMVRFPEQRLTVIVLANQTSVSPSQLALSAADLCLAEVYEE
jgi:CubicO group peptidase (beta-lactamase class C family)